MKIILISGKQGAGKTTLARALVSALNEIPETRAANMTFAEPLYAMHDFCWGYLKHHGIEMPFVKDGYLLQMLGTEWGRDRVDPNIWVKLTQARIDEFLCKEGKLFKQNYFIISDCRFRNEFTGFPEALTIRLNCDKEVRKARVEMWRDTDEHLSETDLDMASLCGLFNMYFNTSNVPTEQIVKEIMQCLEINQPQQSTGKSSYSIPIAQK